MSNVKTHFVLNNNYWNCKYCTSKYKYDPSGNTSNRMTHLKGQHPEKMVEKKNEEPETKKARIEFFPQISGNSNVNRSITRFFAQYNIPYSAVDSDSFGELMKCSGKSVKLPNRHELSNIHVPQYAAEIRNTNSSLTSNSTISLSFDEYSKGTRRFLSLTCSLIDDSWYIKTKRMSVQAFNLQATGENISESVKNILEGFQYKHIIGVTRDGGSNVKKSCKDLNLQSIHCYDHVISLALNNACSKVEDVKLLMAKVKKIASSFAKSPTATKYLKECGAKETMKSESHTRWNWMHRAIKCLLRNREALDKFIHHAEGKRLSQKKLILDLEDEDYENLIKLYPLFEFFTHQLKMAEGRDSLASAIPYYAFQAQNVIRKKVTNPLIAKFLTKIAEHFDESVKEFKKSELIQIATFLDPRFCKRSNIFTENEWMQIENKIVDKYSEIEENTNSSDISVVPENETETTIIQDDNCAFGWTEFNEAIVQEKRGLKDELCDYVKEKRIEVPMPGNNTTSIALDFWKKNILKYPILSSLSKKYLCIMASSSEPERVFSNLTNLLQNTQRNLLRDDAIEDLMTIRNQMVVEKADINRVPKPQVSEDQIFEYESEEEETEA